MDVAEVFPEHEQCVADMWGTASALQSEWL